MKALFELDGKTISEWVVSAAFGVARQIFKKQFYAVVFNKIPFFHGKWMTRLFFHGKWMTRRYFHGKWMTRLFFHGKWMTRLYFFLYHEHNLILFGKNELKVMAQLVLPLHVEALDYAKKSTASGTGGILDMTHHHGQTLKSLVEFSITVTWMKPQWRVTQWSCSGWPTTMASHLRPPQTATFWSQTPSRPMTSTCGCRTTPWCWWSRTRRWPSRRQRTTRTWRRRRLARLKSSKNLQTAGFGNCWDLASGYIEYTFVFMIIHETFVTFRYRDTA